LSGCKVEDILSVPRYITIEKSYIIHTIVLYHHFPAIKSGITAKISHHNFAIVLKRSGASTEFISESLGHHNLATKFSKLNAGDVLITSLALFSISLRKIRISLKSPRGRGLVVIRVKSFSL